MATSNANNDNDLNFQPKIKSLVRFKNDSSCNYIYKKNQQTSHFCIIMALFNWQSVWSIGLYSLYCNFRSMRQKEKLLCMQANKQTIRWQNDYNTIPFVQKKVNLSFALCLFIEWERTWWELRTNSAQWRMYKYVYAFRICGDIV